MAKIWPKSNQNFFESQQLILFTGNEGLPDDPGGHIWPSQSFCPIWKRDGNLLWWRLPSMLRLWQKRLWSTLCFLFTSWRIFKQHANVYGIHGHSISFQNYQSRSSCGQSRGNQQCSSHEFCSLKINIYC